MTKMTRNDAIDQIQQNALKTCAILDCLKELIESDCSGENLELGTSAKSGLAHIIKYAADLSAKNFELCWDITDKDKGLNVPFMFQQQGGQDD